MIAKLTNCATSVHKKLEIFPSFTENFMDIALRRSEMPFLFLLDVSEPPEAQLIHTLSKFHYLTLELYPTDRHSSLECAIDGRSCLLFAFLNPKTCHLSNLRSINLISSLFPVSLSLFLSSIVGALHRPPWPFPNIKKFAYDAMTTMPFYTIRCLA